ncbi:hypothetical protein GCM10010415_17250 [Streptomyces atrovirens]|uniref:PASTA domain-containing protein n=1 Tax=Streptomyces atrovirens TaxID=285556 RepID=A0ABW0E186_9ACTN
MKPALAVAALMSLAACGESSAPKEPAGATNSARAEKARPSADATPVAAVMPDLVGGNAGRAAEQMGSGGDVVFEDASGQGRPVDDPAAWKICGSRPGPNQQITDYPVVLDVVRTSESCA